MKKTKITIGIPAYNEGENAAKLVKSLLKQKGTKTIITKIIVISDGSKDKTGYYVKKIKSPILQLIDDPINKGLAYRQNQIFKLSTTDVSVILNADIRIKDNHFIENLCLPIILKQADLTSGKIVELPQNTFFERSLWASMKMKDLVLSNFDEGNNIYKCHGPVRAFSKKLYKSIKYRVSEGEDMFTYLYAMKHKMQFKYARKAVALYRLPDNIRDHLKQSVRFHNAIKLNKKEFGDLVEKSFSISPKYYLYALVKDLSFFVKNSYLLIFYFCVLFLVKFNFAQKLVNAYEWDVRSSKSL